MKTLADSINQSRCLLTIVTKLGYIALSRQVVIVDRNKPGIHKAAEYQMTQDECLIETTFG